MSNLGNEKLINDFGDLQKELLRIMKQYGKNEKKD